MPHTVEDPCAFHLLQHKKTPERERETGLVQRVSQHKAHPAGTHGPNGPHAFQQARGDQGSPGSRVIIQPACFSINRSCSNQDVSHSLVELLVAAVTFHEQKLLHSPCTCRYPVMEVKGLHGDFSLAFQVFSHATFLVSAPGGGYHCHRWPEGHHHWMPGRYE